MPRFEDFHFVEYPDEILRAACVLAKKHLIDRRLPDSAVDILDQAGALRAGIEIDGIASVEMADIERVVARMAKIPEGRVSEDELAALRNLDEELKAVVFGQDDAVSAICSSIMASRSGLGEPERPVASLLFVGPTGVGKTEIAKTLASVLNIELVRFDMSEYQEQHATARLIGSPPGYVGFEQGGLLVAAIRKTPHCVLLLDEIEKAHLSIMNLLLQVMDYATLTDNTGQRADLRNAIIIMTSNAGARELARRAIGFDGNTSQAAAMDKEIECIFSPEFRNRLDDIIKFNAMSGKMAKQITAKALKQLNERLAHRQITLIADNEAIDHIARKGINTEYGAREIMRIVQRDIKKQLSRAILFDGIESGETLRLAIKDGAIAICRGAQCAPAMQKPGNQLETTSTS